MKRSFDLEGIRLATFQARLCASSLYRSNASSPVFLRRLFKSDYLLRMDEGNTATLSLDEEEAFREIENQYGDKAYGRIRYPEDALYWIGWFYRYVAYTRGIPSRLVYRLIKPEYLLSVYPVYHTQDEEWVFSRVLDALELTEDDFDINERYKAIVCDRIESLKLVCPKADK